jgi:putative ATPase
VVFMASAAKSNAVYTAYNAATQDARNLGSLEVPLHLRNAPTKLMKEIGYGKGYQYDHDIKGGVALDQQCLPDALVGREYYQPTERGVEMRIGEKLEALRAQRRKKRDDQ